MKPSLKDFQRTGSALEDYSRLISSGILSGNALKTLESKFQSALWASDDEESAADVALDALGLRIAKKMKNRTAGYGPFTPEQMEMAKEYLDSHEKVPGFDKSKGPATDDDAEQLLDSGWQPFRDASRRQATASVKTSRGTTGNGRLNPFASPVTKDAKGRLVGVSSRVMSDSPANITGSDKSRQGHRKQVSAGSHLTYLCTTRNDRLVVDDPKAFFKVKGSTEDPHERVQCPGCVGSCVDNSGDQCKRCKGEGWIDKTASKTAKLDTKKIMEQTGIYPSGAVVDMLERWSDEPSTEFPESFVPWGSGLQKDLQKLVDAGIVEKVKGKNVYGGEDNMFRLTPQYKTAQMASKCKACGYELEHGPLKSGGDGDYCPSQSCSEFWKPLQKTSPMALRSAQDNYSGWSNICTCGHGKDEHHGDKCRWCDSCKGYESNAKTAGSRECKQFVEEYKNATPDQRQRLKEKCQRGQVRGVDWSVVQWQIPLDFSAKIK
jgi:hypothetical protein